MSAKTSQTGGPGQRTLTRGSDRLVAACRETAVRFCFGYAINERMPEAILALPEAAWRPAIDGDNQARDGGGWPS